MCLHTHALGTPEEYVLRYPRRRACSTCACRLTYRASRPYCLRDGGRELSHLGGQGDRPDCVRRRRRRRTGWYLPRHGHRRYGEPWHTCAGVSDDHTVEHGLQGCWTVEAVRHQRRHVERRLDVRLLELRWSRWSWQQIGEQWQRIRQTWDQARLSSAWRLRLRSDGSRDARLRILSIGRQSLSNLFRSLKAWRC